MIAAAFLALHLFDSIQTTTVHRHVRGWSVTARSDKFTKGVTCSVDNGRMEFRDDVLIFHLGRRAVTTDAVFRVDGGAVRSVHEATYDDQRRGYVRRGGPLENPSDGDVALPSFYVAGAKYVYIRPWRTASIRWFDVSGFPDALALARRMNCPDIGP
ncbi:MAG TPA: hypothetical protein VKQ70_12530 [Caulobacteraceae bacterium]|nr:hypothetical protein [Caulobacteraceae bacterium]